MSIKEENKALYPPNWNTEIRPSIMKRAKGRCETCGVENYAVVRKSDRRIMGTPFKTYKAARDSLGIKEFTVIVLTIAHLDHDPTNNYGYNLKALCQRCHNRYDRDHRQANAARTRMVRKGAAT